MSGKRLVNDQYRKSVRYEETRLRAQADARPITINKHQGGRSTPAFNQWAKGNKKRVPSMPTSYKS